MSRRERDKGRKGEREIAVLYETRGFEVRGLEGSGDHLCVAGPASGVLVHSEVKRQETARPWLWWEQACAEAEPGAVPVVHFRRNRSQWLALTSAAHFADLVQSLERARSALAACQRRIGELERGDSDPF